jgi:HAD superfamily phosphoserine phosphatase-like hydrolase
MVHSDTKTKLAIFDIDGTVFRSEVMMEIIDRMIQRGLLPKRAYQGLLEAKDSWKDRQGSFEQYSARVVHLIQHHFGGVLVAEFEQIAEQVIDEVRFHQYRYTRDLMGELRGKGYILLAISGMLKQALELYNRTLEFDYIFGSELQVESGAFTSKPHGMQPYHNKSETVRYFLSEHGEFTLDDSYGVGDTEDDEGFLELVANPVAFNPNKKLFDIAQKRGWPVVVERKDVIYELGPDGYSVDK